MPSHSKVLVGENKNNLLDYIAIIPILIIFYFINKLKRNIYPESQIEVFGFIIGIVLAILFIPIHELTHCLFCPKNTGINIYYSVYGITCYPLVKFSKWRYIAMALTPAILLGFIPMIIWVFIPAKYILLNSIIITFSEISLSTTTADIRNAILTMITVSSNDYIQASGKKIYWFR